MGLKTLTKTIFSSEEMLSKLVSFDTTSARSNLDLIHWVQNYLQGYGVSSTLIKNQGGTKANLHAVVGREDIPGIVLSGHTDVVPVEGQAWNSDPFTLLEKDGLFHGRGTCDMKAFIAVVLAKLPQMLERGMETPLHFAFSYDEEVGCLGAYSLVDHLKTMPVKPKLCIVGEPTGMKPIIGHKGICDYDCIVRGKEAHSSLAPYAVNAVENAAELVAHIKSIARRMASDGPFNRQFDPPFTTVHVGVMKGGTALNIVPNRCEFSLEIRNIPEVNPEDLMEEIRRHAFQVLEPRMKDIDVETGFEFKPAAGVPAFDMDKEDEAVHIVLSLSGANTTEKVSFATEAGIFQQGGIPTVVCGPGSITEAHKPNEFVAQEQIVKCENFINRLIAQARTRAAA